MGKGVVCSEFTEFRGVGALLDAQGSSANSAGAARALGQVFVSLCPKPFLDEEVVPLDILYN